MFLTAFNVCPVWHHHSLATYTLCTVHAVCAITLCNINKSFQKHLSSFETTVCHELECIAFLLLQKHDDLSMRNKDCLYILLQSPLILSQLIHPWGCLGLECLLKITENWCLKFYFKIIQITWAGIGTEFPIISEMAPDMLLPFYTTYLCKATVSSVWAIINWQYQPTLKSTEVCIVKYSAKVQVFM